MNLISNRTLEGQTSVLAQYLRDDALHQSKNIEGSNLRKILVGLAYEFLRQRDLVNEVYSEYDPNNTTKFIEEWEAFVGIPDDCFSATGTLDQRRKNVLLKLIGSNVTTKKQFEDIATVLGFSITVTAGGDSATLPLQLPFILTSQVDVPFIIIVTLLESQNSEVLPLTLPFTLSSDKSILLKCFLEKLKPVNCIIYYRYV